MMHTRRDFGKIALAAIPFADALANVNSKFGGVQIGAITYSFRETNDLDAIIKMMVRIGLGEAELMSNHAEAAAGAPSPVASAPVRPATPPAPAPSAPRRGPRPPMTDEQIAAARARNADLRRWRLSVSMDKFKDVRKKFDTAGIQLQLLCFNVGQGYFNRATPPVIDRKARSFA